MSLWWDLDFSVAGQEPLTEKLKEALPTLRFDEGGRLFHHVEVISSLPGFVVVHGSRNYHGGGAICELVRRFPKLSFQGSLHSDMGYDQYTLFYGQDGKTTFQDLVIPDFETRFPKRLSPAEIERQIAELGDKISRLEFTRSELNEYLARLDATGDRGTVGTEAIIPKVDVAG